METEWHKKTGEQTTDSVDALRRTEQKIQTTRQVIGEYLYL